MAVNSESVGLYGLLQAPLKRIPHYTNTLLSLMKNLIRADFGAGGKSEHDLLAAAVQIALDQITKLQREISESVEPGHPGW